MYQGGFGHKRRGIPGGGLLLAALIGGVIGYVGFSKTFERVAPSISAPAALAWNFRTPLKVAISDNIGVVAYHVVYRDAKGETVLADAKLAAAQPRIDLPVSFPAGAVIPSGPGVLTVEASDASLWHFFGGNKAVAQINVTPDVTPPSLALVNNSYMITRGGAALVVFAAQDPHLAKVDIALAGGPTFEAAPFYKPGYYAALIAWPMNLETFDATVEAVDAAGNKAAAHVPLYQKTTPYRESNINIDDAFLGGKIATLGASMPQTARSTPVDRFKYVNEAMRDANQKQIIQLTGGHALAPVSDFVIAPFYPLQNGQVVAHYGDHRHFFYNNAPVSESYHMGLDLASNQAAPVVASNKGKVLYAADNGIFGNMPLIDHGLGLYTLYGHCTSIAVKAGQEVAAGTVIARTGTTGLALGDHLHFGIVVQGIDVRPVEWLDAHWIKLNISDVIADAKKMIDGQPK